MITRHSVLLVSLDLKRAIEYGSKDDIHQAERILHKIFRTMASLGLGQPLLDENGATVGLHKYARRSLSQAAKAFLLEQRIPLSLWGPIACMADNSTIQESLFEASL